MIKSLKRRFIIIYMTILSIFLFTILAGIYIIVYHSEDNQSQQIMELALMNNTRDNERMSSPPKKIIEFSTDNVSIINANEGYSQDDEYLENFDDDLIQDEHFPNFNLPQKDNFLNDFYSWNDFEDFDKNKNHHDDDFIPELPDTPDFDDENPDDFPYQDDFYEPPWENQRPQNDYNPINDVTTNINIFSNVDTPQVDIPFETTTPELESLEPTEPITVEVPIEEPQTQETTDTTYDETLPIDTLTDTTTETTIDTTQETTSTTDITTTLETTLTTTITTTSTTPQTTNDTTNNSIILNEDIFKNSSIRKKEPIIEYEGNLARNTIYVNTDKDGDIRTISYQYFESSNNISLEQTVGNIISSGVMSGKVEIDDVKFRYAVFDKEDNDGYDIVFLDRAIELSTLNRLLAIFIVVGTLGLIVLFGVSWLLASWAVTPIAVAWDKQKQFIADASHELKTPLTVIATNTDVILANEEDTVRNQSKWLRYIKSETVRMSKLVSDLLYIAKSDVNEVSMIISEFNISHVVSGICLVFETIAFESGKTLNYNIEEDILYSGDEDRIKQLVNILVDNAIKHSDINAEITVNLKRDTKDKIKLTVINTNGEDIPQGMEERLFERFFRVDKSRNHNNGSHGLGLNIAQSIIKNHNGSISVSSTSNHVVTFTVIL
ncbi:MAG: sensor histidine kinase [Oscillospiraceae bacterium]